MAKGLERMGEINPLVAFGGFLVGVLGAVLTWLAARSRAQVDESALVLGKWKELVETHEKAIASLREEFATYRRSANDEIEALRKRLREVEDAFATYRKDADKRVRERDSEIAGLKRQISQISQSTAVQLTRRVPKKTPEDQEAIEKLDRAGDNSIPKGEGK